MCDLLRSRGYCSLLSVGNIAPFLFCRSSMLLGWLSMYRILLELLCQIVSTSTISSGRESSSASQIEDFWEHWTWCLYWRWVARVSLYHWNDVMCNEVSQYTLYVWSWKTLKIRSYFRCKLFYGISYFVAVSKYSTKSQPHPFVKHDLEGSSNHPWGTTSGTSPN
jgi:hypothetical protein